MCLGVLMTLCLCITCMPGAYGGQKPTLNPMGLELQVVVSKALQESCIDLSQMEREVDTPHPIPNLEAIRNNIYMFLVLFL